MSDLLKLLLVEDDVLFRLGLATCLQRESSIELVVEASDGTIKVGKDWSKFEQNGHK